MAVFLPDFLESDDHFAGKSGKTNQGLSITNSLEPPHLDPHRPRESLRMCRLHWLSLSLLAAALSYYAALATTASAPAEPPADKRPHTQLPAWQGPLPSLWLTDLTWSEIARAQAAGYDTVLIPTGGTEPGGPHLVTGKHNFIVQHAAQQIAARHGQILIAPVLPYVPQPTAHQPYPGTISVPAEVFQQVVAAAAHGFLQQGFRRVVLLGDSGANQAPLQAAAHDLNRRWAHLPTPPVLFLDHYYSRHGQVDWLQQQGFSPTHQGTHAALADTAELLAIAPQQVRSLPVPSHDPKAHDPKTSDPSDPPRTDFDGRPDWATPDLGDTLLELKVEAALRQLQSLDRAPSTRSLPKLDVW